MWRPNFFFWNGHGLVYFSPTQLFFQETNPFSLLFQISFFFCPDIGRRGLLTVDLISCHTPNKAIFPKARTPGFPGKLILHMRNLLQKEVGKKKSLGRNWWLCPSVTTLILPSLDLQQSLIWEIGNHDIVETQGESVLGMDFWKKTQLCIENSGRRKRQCVMCIPHYLSGLCWGLENSAVGIASPRCTVASPCL